MTEADNKILARRFLEEVVNSGDVSRLPEFLAPDYRVRHSLTLRYMSSATTSLQMQSKLSSKTVTVKCLEVREKSALVLIEGTRKPREIRLAK